MTTTTSAADRFAAAITEAAVREVARHIIAATVRANPPEWGDYPEIGEYDWKAVQQEVERTLDRLAAQREKYDCAYRHLASRAVVVAVTTTVAITGTRTLCQHPGCGVEIEQVIGSDEWVHIDSCRPDHIATPVEPVLPVLGRQALTHPSSLVDALLEAAKYHGVPMSPTSEAYRAAEQAAGLLLHILRGEQ